VIISASALLFARNFIKHPKMLGSIIPSSRFLIRNLLGKVDWPSVRVIVEFGPGVGTFTSEILRRMHPDARFVAIEMNRDFVELLERTIDDQRLHVVHGSAEEISTILDGLGLGRADVVISGIPFSTMPDGVADQILHSTHDSLSERGMLLIYQFSSDVRHRLEKIFGEVIQGFEPLNILPARLFYCRKRS
jgi:phospholipid N-methyltransferase